MNISGDLSVNNDLDLKGHTLNVDGNVDVSGLLTLNNGTLNCEKDLTVKHYYGRLSMKNSEDTISVKGNMNFDGGRYSSSLTNGKLYIGGDCNITGSGFKASGDHETIFNGKGRQSVSLTNSNSYFCNIVVDKGKDDELIFTDNFNCKTITNKNNSKITFANGGSVGETLTGDKTIGEDYILAMGTLDLNGHTLTVNGDFIQAGGEVKVNGGKLIVKGDYRIQTKKADGDKTTYDYSTGILNMTNESDSVEVSGDFVMGSIKSHKDLLTDGTLKIGGNFEQKKYNADDNFINGENFSIIFNGSSKQSVKFDAPNNSILNNVKFENTVGVSLDTSVYVSGTVYDVYNSVCGKKYLYITKLSQIKKNSFGGNIYLNNSDNDNDVKLTGDFTSGSLTCHHLHIEGYDLKVKNLTANGNVYLEGGRIECKNDLKLNSYSNLNMTVENDYVFVGGDFVSNSRYDTSNTMTDGVLEIKGDFRHNENSKFVCSGNHKTILSGKGASNGRVYIQTVKMYSPGVSKFNRLVINKPRTFYSALNENNSTVELETMCNELIEDYTDTEAPSKVGGLAASEYDSTSVHIVWKQSSDNVKVLGYEIYRDGSKLYTTSRSEFIDTGLEPETTYIYEIYAFDEARNYSAVSNKLKIKTAKDEESPSVPQNVKVKCASGSSVTVCWDQSADNVGVEGYKLYCNNKEIADLTDKTEYKHTGLDENKKYEYKVTAYDKAGNRSDFSESVTGYVVMPKITSVTPKDMSIIGGKNKTITVLFNNNGGDKNTVKFEYKKNGDDDYAPMSDELVGQENYSAEERVAKYIWDIEGLKGSYDIRITLSDEDGNEDVKELTYTVDSQGPSAPTDLAAVSDNGVVDLKWNCSVSANCKYYNIYRQDDKISGFRLIARADSSLIVRYVDKDVCVGKTYSYKIKGVNSFDIEGEFSNEAFVTVGEDKLSPWITGIDFEKERLNEKSKIKVLAVDNIDVKNVSLEYKNEKDEKWTLVGTEDFEDNCAVFELDTTKLDDGKYVLKAIAEDGNKNKSEAFEKKCTVDNTGISKITLNKDGCSSGSSYITLKWEDVLETDFGYFSVEVKDKEEKYSEVGRTSQTTGFHVENLKPNTEYTFRVVGYDNIGNRGEESDEITLSTKSDSIAPVIASFYPASNSFNSKINFDIKVSDNDAVSGLKLRYSYDKAEDKNWIDLANITAEKSDSKYEFKYGFDVSSMPEGKIFIEASAEDLSGNISESCVSEFVIDHTAPDKITDLVSDISKGNIHLIWTTTSDDTTGFEIYRCEDGKTAYSKLADCKTKDYYDTSAEIGSVYTYKIIAVDAAGNKSGYSNETIAQISVDDEKPDVCGFTYKNGSTVPANCKLGVVTRDNFKLSSVTVEYKRSSSENGIWSKIDTFNLNSNYECTDFEWKTDNLSEGKYTLKAVCTDFYGNLSEPFVCEYTLDKTAPDAPVIKAHQGNFEIVLKWNDVKTDDFAYYRLYKKLSLDEEFTEIGKTDKLSYTDSDVIPHKNYTYKIEAYDNAGNYSESEEIAAFAYDEDKIPPVIDVAEEMYGVVGTEIELDASACTDNVRMRRFTWKMGDGNAVYGVRTSYAYSRPGTYTATLIAEDAAKNKSETKIKVTIYEKNEYGSVRLKVVDSSNQPIRNAYVYLYEGDASGIKSMRTNSDGELSIYARIGSCKAAAYGDGYLPSTEQIEINSYGDNGSKRIVLQKGDIVTGNIEVHRMSLEEMEEAGVDLNNPVNYHTFKFTVELTFEQRPIPTVIEYIYVGGAGGSGGCGYISGWSGGGIGGGGGGAGSGGLAFAPVIRGDDPENQEPILAYIRVTQHIEFMKDMYSVNLGVINNASPEFKIKDSSASLILPDGLSLATNRNALTQDMDVIVGGESKSVSWAVRGDRKGEYDLEANFGGTLMPFEAPVSANFKTSTPFKVGAGDGIHIYVHPESAAYIGEKYYIQFEVTNEGEDTFYNLTTDFGKYTNPGYKQMITVTKADGSVEEINEESACYEIDTPEDSDYLPVISCGNGVRTKEFKPGDVLKGTYCQVFSAQGDPDEVYYELIESAITDMTEGLGVQVHIAPIPSHITKYNVKQKIVDNTWADPVDMTTGAFTDSVTAMSVTGESSLNLNLNYSSLNNENKGQLGYGWSHDFETYLDVRGSVINVHWNKTNYASFADERYVTRNVNGEIVDNRIVVSKPNDTGAKNYAALSSGMDDYFLSRDSNNIYTLEMPGGEKYVFDSEGKLIKIIQANEKTTSIEYAGNSMIITENISGSKLVLNYNNEGLVTSVGDGNGRLTTIVYENDCIKSVTNPLNETIEYTYDENHRLLTAAVSGENPYVTNEYDEEGRVITQDDADPATPLTTFEYSVENNGKFTVDSVDRNGNSVQYVSDGMGHIISVTNQNGYVKKFSYDNKGNLIYEKDENGGIKSYTYNADGELASIKEPDGNVTSMSYDANGNILSVTAPTGEQNLYTYNPRNLLDSETEYSGAVKNYTYNENGQILTQTISGLGTRYYEYNGGRIVSSTDYEGHKSLKSYDDYGNLRTETDSGGNQTVYAYDALNRLISVTDSDGTESYTYDQKGNKTSVTDKRGNITYYNYNSNNFLVSMSTPKGITLYEYNGEGQLTKQTNPDKTTVTNIYDGVGNVIESVNENGEKTTFTYDNANQMLTKTVWNGDTGYTESYEYYSGGNLKKTVFADGTSESYEYDNQNRLVKVTDHLGNSTVSEYDASENLLSSSDAEGNTVKNTYDRYGRMTKTTDANGNVTTFDSYDFNGNCLQKTNPAGQVICFEYDSRGLMTKSILKAKNAGEEDISVSYEYDAAGRVKKYIDEEGHKFFTEYDSAGNIIKVTDAEGNVVKSNYDEMNNLTLSTDAVGVETQYNYDCMGNLIETIANLNTAREEKSQNSYDKLGRVTKSVDAENGTSKYTYDRFGNVKTQTDPGGGKTVYNYDSMNRVTSSVNPMGNKKTYTYDDVGRLSEEKNANSQSTSYEYYKNGWIKSFTDELGTVSYTYDKNGNVLTVKDENGTITREYDNMNRVTKYTDFRGNEIKYSYDNLGNLVKLTYPGGRIVRYTYYKTGSVKTVTDWNNRVTSFEYDGNSRLIKTSRPDGSVEERTYDANGRVSTIVDKNGKNVINQKVYSYDESGNVTEISSSDGTSIDKLSGAEMEYNKCNQLIKYNGKEVKYDAEGNMTYGPLNGKMAKFVYDCRNRLVSAGGITYGYDAENNRISQTENGVKTEYVVDSVNKLTRILTSEKEGDTTYYIHGAGLLAQENDGEYLIYHFNNIGSTEAVTDIDGKTVETFDYGPYGELTSKNKNGIIFLYNGEYGVVTDGNGLYYMRARYYNPEIKRFINQDVVVGTITESPTLNRYAYVNGNPISLTDPFGLSPVINWASLGHMLLDIAGMLPVVGFVFDGVNAAWYLAEGDYFNAACSFVSALPGAGDFIGAFAKSANKCKIVTAFHKAGAIGNISLNMYTMGNITKKYLSGGEHSWEEIRRDLATVAMSSVSSLGSAKDFGTSYCFVAGTLVTTEDGFKPIEEIEVGDKVLSEDELTGEVAVKKVTQTYVNETDELVHIGVNGETISATPTHPFYVDKLGWTLARSLKAGDVLVLSNGELVTVEWVQHEILESPIKVYNFEVEDFHTYFVGENGVFVHNRCGPEDFTNKPNADAQPKSSDIRFSQNSISSKFKNGSSVDDMIQGLRKGTVDPSDIPAIRIFEKDGALYTLDNRRLYAFQQAGIENIPYQWATSQEIANEAWKFTTTNGGVSIEVRGR